MLSKKSKTEIPARRSTVRPLAHKSTITKKKRLSIRELPDRCRLMASLWTHSMRSFISLSMTSSEVSQIGRIEERRFGGFSTRFFSLVIRYHIKARSVNRLFCQFHVQSRARSNPVFGAPN
jgi:hypothetical protein